MPTQEGLIVGPPRLVAAVGFGAPLDFPVDGLEALADQPGDLFDRELRLQAVSDGDPVVLGEEAW